MIMSFKLVSCRLIVRDFLSNEIPVCEWRLKTGMSELFRSSIMQAISWNTQQ